MPLLLSHSPGRSTRADRPLSRRARHRFRRAASNQHQSEQDLGSGYKIGGHMGLQIRLLNAGNSTKSFAAFAALERGRQHKNLAKSLHVYWGSAAAPCFDSEQFRSAPRTGSPSPGRLLMHQTACARRSLAGMIGGRTLGGSPMFDMRRREFVALLGGAAAAWPVAARAQRSERAAVGSARLNSCECAQYYN